MYSTIVVGTDGSSTASVAVTRAGELAKLCGATVHLVHGCGSAVIADASMMAVPVTMSDDVIERLEGELDKQAEPIRSQGVDVVVHVEMQSGPEAVLGYAESVDADLIVVGNQGMTGKRRFILGSVPNAVSHHAPCSVLIVRTT